METLLHVGLSNALAATVLAAAVALLGRLWRRPALLHALWLLVLLRLLVPPIFFLSLPWPSSLTRPALLPEVSEAPMERAQTPVSLAESSETSLSIPEASSPEDTLPLVAEPPTVAVLPEVSTAAVVLLGWATGSMIAWGLALRRVRHIQVLLRHARPAAPDVQTAAQRMAARLGLAHCPAVRMVHAWVPPSVWPFVGQPVLLLPAALWHSLDEAQRDTLLAHELAHLRRRDHWVRWLELVVAGLYWWHPVVWLARRALRECEEQCCDAWVVSALPDAAEIYASALLKTVTFLSQTRSVLPILGSGIGQVASLKRRLTMIVRGTPRRSLSWAGTLVVGVVGILLLSLMPTWAEPSPGEQPTLPQIAVPPAAPTPETVPYRIVPHPTAGASRFHADPFSATGDDPIQVLKDEIELLEAQMQVKRAKVKATKMALDAAMQRFQRVAQLHNRGAVSAEVIEQTQAETEAAKAQLLVAEAEVLEPEVRLKQAKRRLAALEKRPSEKASEQNKPEVNTPPKPIPASGLDKEQEKALKRYLEQDLRTLLVELAQLREKIKTKHDVETQIRFSLTAIDKIRDQMKSVEGGAKLEQALQAWLQDVDISHKRLHVQLDTQDVEARLQTTLQEVDKIREQLKSLGERMEPLPVLKTRTVNIPFVLDPRCPRVSLYVSSDEGCTWKKVASAPGSQKNFTFQAPTDGVYWFSALADNPKYKKEPPDRTQFKPMIKVRVQIESDQPK